MEAAFPKVPWRIRDPLLVVLWTQVITLLLAILAAIAVAAGVLLRARSGVFLAPGELEGFMRHLLTSEGWGDAFFLIQELVTVFFLSVLLIRPYGVRMREFFKRARLALDARISVRLMFFALLLVFGVMLAVVAVLYVVGNFTPVDGEKAVGTYLSGLEREAQTIISSEIGWLRILLVVLIAPPIEELLFRGFLYASLRKRFASWSANLISSGIFALSHTYIAFGLPNILIIGILGAYTYEKTRSLSACILFHVFWNLYCAANYKPVLWYVLAGGMLALYIYSRRAASTGRVARRQRLWWKGYSFLYAVLLALALGLGEVSLLGFSVEVPLLVGLVSYAWRRGWLSRFFWRVYGVLYTCWILVDMAMHDINAAVDFSTVLVALLINVPALIVLWRLGDWRAATSDVRREREGAFHFKDAS